MKKLLIFLLFLPLFCFSQKQGNIWMFGQGGALDFNGGTPTAFSGSQVFGSPTQSGDYIYSEGCTSISDSSGNLLFYSNGSKIWNRLNHIMPNGDSLDGFYSSTTAAFAIPIPLSSSLYYLFTTDGLERYLQHGLRYSIVDMCLDNGNGDIINTQKNIPLLDSADEKLCAIAHPNGTDIWLIAHKHFTNSFYTYLITPSGINAPIITNIGSIHTGGFGFYNGCGTAIGQMKASSNGNKIGLAFTNVSPSVAELFDFNTTTGVLSNVISLLTYNGEYGVEFSNDNSKLYITSGHGLVQYDISSDDQSTINLSVFQISSASCEPGPLQLGPDGKIYVARCTTVLGIINSPNNIGISCNYIDYGINISPATHNTSLPSFIAGYNYKNNERPGCITTGIENDFLFNQLKISPNPFSTSTQISFDKTYRNIALYLYDLQGKLLLQNHYSDCNQITLHRNQLSNGLYFLKIIIDDMQIETRKIVISDK